jgi:hypothetical protein
MKKLASTTLLFCILLTFKSLYVVAQTPAPPPVKPAENASAWGIKFYGFVRNDIMYDTRQVVSARPANQGELLLYPANISKDLNGKDINAAASFTMLAITSRLGGTITGPDAFGAKTSAVLEAEFFGNANGNENVFRLRHAFAKLDWAKTQLAFGQYWHPLFVVDCFPGVISFNTGMPFQPFARNPQVRLTQKLGKDFNLIVAALSQTEAFVSPGSSTGIALGSSTAIQTFANDAVIPNLHAQLQYKSKSFVAGAAFDYKVLRPALKATSGAGVVSTNEKVKSSTFELYAKVITPKVIIKAEYVAGQNMFDHLMFGGYLAYGTTPNITYKPMGISTYWGEIVGTGKKIIPGIFFGYAKNNGASATGAIASYARSVAANGASIDNVLRIAPRLEIVSGKFKFGTEIEYTAAAYGTAGSDGKVTGTTDKVNNTRLLFITSFSF